MAPRFLSLPAELRNEIYKYLLVRRDHINPFRGDQELGLNFLCTNKTILREASPFLYENNLFDLATPPRGLSPIKWQSKLVPQFLEGIGSMNASRIRSIRTDFPRLCALDDLEGIAIGCEDQHILETILSHCHDLKSFTLAAQTLYAFEDSLKLDTLNNPAICERALELVATHFSAITSLQEIVVEVYVDMISLSTRDKMQSRGWKLKVVNPMDPEGEACLYAYDDYDEDDVCYNMAKHNPFVNLTIRLRRHFGHKGTLEEGNVVA